MTEKGGKLRELLRLLRDPDTPKLPRLAVLLAIVYLISPVDLVPDMAVPVLGFIDDLVVLWLSTGWLARSGAKARRNGQEDPPTGAGGKSGQP